MTLNSLSELDVPDPRRHKTIRQKFSSSFVVDPVTGCWNSRKLDTKGYGQIGSGNRGRKLLAHRISWQIFKNELLAPNVCVCHHCDNNACVNPDHLFTGTQLDNIRDQVSKNRQAKGTRNGRSKLTEEDVRKIREYGFTKSERKIAKEFGVTKGAIYPIRHKINWKHI